jgi:hypothetical protein
MFVRNAVAAVAVAVVLGACSDAPTALGNDPQLAPAALAKGSPKRPDLGSSTLSGSVACDVADPFAIEGPYAPECDGSLTLNVNQGGVSSSIVMANIDLPDGLEFSEGGEIGSLNGGGPSIIAEIGTTCDTDGIQWSYGNSLTATNFSCYNLSGNVEFTLSSGDAVITNYGVTAPADLDVSSQYRTNAHRKVKAQTWVIEGDDLISVTAPLPPI